MSDTAREQRRRFAERLDEAGLGTERFIRVQDGSKAPIDHDLYEADDGRLGGNYGVYGGYGGGDGEYILVNVDIDDYSEDDASESLEAILSLPETFTVESPHTDGETGGHRFYKVHEDAIAALHDIHPNNKTNVQPSWGEIRVDNQYVVGPGSQIDSCKHDDPDRDTDFDSCPSEPQCREPEGGYYAISNDVAIAEVGVEQLIDALVTDTEYERGNEPDDDFSESSIDIDGDATEEITADDLDSDGGRPGDEEIQARLQRAFNNPHDGDRIKKVYDGNYKAAGFNDRSSAEFWLSNRIDTFVGHGNKHVVLSVLEDGNLKKLPRRRDRSYVESLLQNVGNNDIVETGEHEFDSPEIADNRSHYDSIDNAVFDPDENFVLNKPPREGGSHWSMKHLVGTGDPVLIIVPRHSIGEHHIETLKGEILDRGQWAVHYSGTHQACEHNGQDCPHSVDGEQEYFRLQHTVRGKMHQKQAVSADDCPEGWCGKEFINEAMRQADVITTVPQLLPKVSDEREIQDMRLLFDEEQALSWFWPNSVEVATFEYAFDSAGVPTIYQSSTNVSDHADVFEDIAETIEDEQEERQESDGGFRRTSFEVIFEQAHEAIQDIEDAISAVGIESELRDRDESVNMESATDLILERLEEQVDIPESNAAADRIHNGIREHCAPYFWNEAVEPEAFLSALAFPYEERTFDFKRTGPGTYTLRLIGNREQEPFYADDFRQFEQIGIIAGTTGERFFDELAMDAEVIEIDSFRYADDYIVIPVADVDEEGSTEPVHQQRARVKRTARALNERAKPQMAVCGTNARAAELAGGMNGGNETVISDPQNPAVEMGLKWKNGGTAVIYENSVVSRGIDSPFFDITTICETGFATPYWEAKRRALRGGGDEWREAISHERELKARELTNAAVRSSPTRGVEDACGAKFIIVSDHDANRLLYLQDRKIDRIGDEEAVADLVDTLTIDGWTRAGDESVYEDLNENDRRYIEVAMRETIEQKQSDRPSWSIHEVSHGIESGRILFDKSVCNEIVAEIAKSATAPTPRDIRDRVTADNELIDAALRVLRKKGTVSVSKESGSSGGRPVDRYRLE